MNFDWQNVLAAGVVIAALGYVARRVWCLSRSKTGPRCMSCMVCGPKPREERLVSIDPPSKLSESKNAAQGEITA